MKTLLKIGGAVLAVLLLLLLAVYLSLNIIIARAVTTMAPRLTNTPVSVSLVSISPFSGEGTISGLRIDSPAGYKVQPAIQLAKVRVKIDLKSLFTDKVIINDIYIDAVAVNVEQKLLSNNVSDLRRTVNQNVEKLSGTAGQTKSSRKYQIDHLFITHGQAKVGTGDAMILFPLADIERRNIGTRTDGITSSEITGIVFSAMTDSVIKGLVSGSFLKQGTKSIGDTIQGVFGN